MLIGLLGGLFLSGMVGSAYADLLTFEDVPGGSVQNIAGIMPTYNGFNFGAINTNNINYLYWIYVEGSSWPYGAYSGDFALLNNFTGIGVITEENNADFTFDGLWAKKWETLPESGGNDSLFGSLRGYNNGNLVWSVNTGLNGSYEYYGAQAGAIDELHLGFGDYFLVDNLELNRSGVTPVPEPTTLLLFGTGIAGLIGSRMKRKR